MDGQEASDLWRRAFFFHQRHQWSAPREYSEDFASYVVLLRLKGNYPSRLEDLSKAFHWISQGEVLVESLERLNAAVDHGDPDEEDFGELYTASERRALLREVDRHIVRPRPVLWEKLALGYQPIDPVQSERARKEAKDLALRKRAADLLEELRVLTEREQNPTPDPHP